MHLFNIALRLPFINKLVVERDVYKMMEKRSRQRYKQLFDLVENGTFSNLMEIGTYKGFNAYHLIKLAQKNSQKVRYYGFDIFEEMTPEIFAKEISKNPFSKSIVEKIIKTSGAECYLFKGFTNKTLVKAYESLPKMDLIFIDGGHSLETIEYDWDYAEKLLGNSGVAIFDDYWEGNFDAGCKKIVDSIDRKKYQVEILPLQDVFEQGDGTTLKIKFAKVTKLFP